jgi:hypothetical protein
MVLAAEEKNGVQRVVPIAEDIRFDDHRLTLDPLDRKPAFIYFGAHPLDDRANLTMDWINRLHGSPLFP